MKLKKKILFILIVVPSFLACDLDTKVDTFYTDQNISTTYETVSGFGNMAYTHVRSGFTAIDNNLFAAVSDEAELTSPSSNTQLFNNGGWNAFNNPDDVYGYNYEGIRAANHFLKEFQDYRTLLAVNRDTLSDNGRQYNLDVQNIKWLRKENRVLRAYFYFELIKRYGGVPLLTEPLSLTDNTDIPREEFDEIVDFIVSEIDAVKDDLQTDWKEFDEGRDGRLTKGAALALKSRVLLYAASPRHNPVNDLEKWQDAAEAAYDVIALNQYGLDSNYRELFLGENTVFSEETIWAIRHGGSNELEKLNYPAQTPGGNSGITPSQNLVSSYEYTASPDPSDPYANRDPRLYYSIVTNNSEWNGRTIEIWEGGQDAATKINSSRTGYYLKKFLNEDLNLVQGESQLRSWIVLRYGEILLNYAEAMNEAFGANSDNGYGMTALEAVNEVRSRPGVQLPPVEATGQGEMRDIIKHERRIELAFEDHRFWDLLRWEDAGQVLNKPLKGIKASKNTNDELLYTEFVVEDRKFISPQMYLYPLPQREINNSDGILKQNPGW